MTSSLWHESSSSHGIPQLTGYTHIRPFICLKMRVVRVSGFLRSRASHLLFDPTFIIFNWLWCFNLYEIRRWFAERVPNLSTPILITRLTVIGRQQGSSVSIDCFTVSLNSSNSGQITCRGCCARELSVVYDKRCNFPHIAWAQNPLQTEAIPLYLRTLLPEAGISGRDK